MESYGACYKRFDILHWWCIVLRCFLIQSPKVGNRSEWWIIPQKVSGTYAVCQVISHSMLVLTGAMSVVFTVDDKEGMGDAADEGTRRKRAETAGEARQRGETGPRRIKQEREIYPLLLNHQYWYYPSKSADSEYHPIKHIKWVVLDQLCFLPCSYFISSCF